MYTTQPSGTETNSQGNDISYYSAAFPDGASIGADTATLYLNATNEKTVNKTLGLTLVAGGLEIGSDSITIEANTTSPTLFDTTFDHLAYNFAAGDRLRLDIGKVSGVLWYWDGAYNDSRLVVENLTVVTLASFTATAHDGYVLLEWETASEIDNAGFNLWRSEAEAEAGPYTKLNADLIPARGGPTTGASYSFRDNTVTNGVTYWYKLEDVDTYGVSTFHGPVAAVAGRVYRLYLPLVLKGH